LGRVGVLVTGGWGAVDLLFGVAEVSWFRTRQFACQVPLLATTLPPRAVLGEAQKELLDDEKRESLLKVLELAKGP
jgi:hypothetical protein